MSKKISGFSLLEVMVVIAIIAFLSMLAMPSFMRFFAKAKRSEAYTQLRALYMAEKAYMAEHGKYSANLNDIGWRAEGKLQYTYGFAGGGEGSGHVTGELKAPASALVGTRADDKGFVIGAAGDIDGDGSPDVLTIDQNGTVTIVVDDLA